MTTTFLAICDAASEAADRADQRESIEDLALDCPRSALVRGELFNLPLSMTLDESPIAAELRPRRLVPRQLHDDDFSCPPQRLDRRCKRGIPSDCCQHCAPPHRVLRHPHDVT